MRRSIPIILLPGLLLCSCAPNDSHGDGVGMNQVPVGGSADASLGKIIGQLPRVDGEGKWDEGKKKYVEEPACNALRKRLAEGQRLTDAQWCKALLDAGVIRVRNRWPEGEDFAISMRQSGWLGVAEIRMKPRTNGLKEAKVGRLFQSTCGTCMAWDYQAALCQPLGRLPPGKHKIVFDVTVERGEEGRMYGEETKPTLPPGILWKGEMSFDVEVVKSVERLCCPREKWSHGPSGPQRPGDRLQRVVYRRQNAIDGNLRDRPRRQRLSAARRYGLVAESRDPQRRSRGG